MSGNEVSLNGVPGQAKEVSPDEKQDETTVEFLASFAGLLATVLFIMTFVFQTFAIPSGSMEKTFGGSAGDGAGPSGIPALPSTLKIWMARGLPASVMVKSSFLSPGTGSPFASFTSTSICTTRVSVRSVGNV